MGLDWNPMGRPKPGHEPEFAAIYGALQMDPKNPARDAWVGRFQKISDPPYATLGAPQIGVDAAADAWLRENLEKPEAFDEARAAMTGRYVLDVMPDCDGFPHYSNYPAARGQNGYERYTLRAQFLTDAVAVIGEELHQKAYTPMLAAQLVAYADALEQRLLPFVKEHGLTSARPKDFKEGDPAAIADILDCTIRWCRFWGSRGHGMEPWF